MRLYKFNLDDVDLSNEEDQERLLELVIFVCNLMLIDNDSYDTFPENIKENFIKHDTFNSYRLDKSVISKIDMFAETLEYVFKDLMTTEASLNSFPENIRSFFELCGSTTDEKFN